MSKQNNQLKNRPRLIVGTPGRINDHLQRKSLDLSNINFLVLDETDRMLDMGFSVQLERIFKYMPEKRQTLMFSATMPQNILQMSKQYLDNPERISVGETNTVAKNIQTDVVKIDQSQKYDRLILELHERNGSVIVFSKTKYGADRMAKNLRRDGFTAEALHGDLRQSKREKVMKNFRDDNFRILVATDIAARGLDVPSIQHVVNYDLPQVAEDYIHRMGRTARAGTSGYALCFVSPQDGRKWHAIECLLDPQKKSNERNYDRTKPKRRKSNASGGKPSERKKSYAKRDDTKRIDRKKPFKKRDDERDNNSKKKPFKKPFKKRDDERNEGKDSNKKTGFKKPFKKRDDNRSDRSDRPKFDKPRGKKPTGKKAAPQKGKSFKSNAPAGSIKKKNTKKSNAKKRNF